MKRRMLLAGTGAMAATAGVAGWLWPGRALPEAEFLAAYAARPPAPTGPVATYHLGHSLVGPDMPAMLAAAAGHRWHGQIGWGTSLRDHWRGEVKGRAEGPAHRAAFAALDSGDYGAVVLTEMVELQDAVRWHDSGRLLAKWAARARAGNPAARVFLYETWHRLDDPAGWEARIAADRAALWEGAILRRALRAGDPAIHVVPGGPVLAAAVRAAEAGDLPGVADRHAFFADEIHLSDLGAWLIAMAHFAVLYGRSPEGLPALLPRGDGTLAGAPEAAAAPLQRLVWQVVAADPLSGAG